AMAWCGWAADRGPPPASVGVKPRRGHRRWAVPRLRASRGGRISATDLALSDEGFEDIGASHRRKAARAIFLADEEHDALLVGQAAVDFGERQRRIAVPVRPASNAGDFDHREIFPPQLIDRGETQLETAVMEFAHAACDGVEPRFEFRRDMARRIVPVAAHAEAQRKNPASAHTRQPRIKRRGFAAMGHETLENELLAGRKMPEIF